MGMPEITAPRSLDVCRFMYRIGWQTLGLARFGVCPRLASDWLPRGETCPALHPGHAHTPYKDVSKNSSPSFSRPFDHVMQS